MNKANGAVVRNKGKGGINWWRYQTVILKLKLIPFTLKYIKDRPNTVVQEDKASTYISQYQESVFIDAGITRLFWCSNSPDLNMIEPCWPYMKRQTTRRGAPVNVKEAEKSWISCWKDMEQGRIQRWIERIIRHVQQVYELEGGNNYREGTTDEEIRGRKTRQAERARRNY
jgi:transposase